MWQYLLYFVFGGGIVTLVAYLSGRSNPLVTTLVANIPILFILNMFLMYKSSGLSGSMVYAKGVLLLLPVFVIFVVVTMLLLPRLGLPMALLCGTLSYLVLPVTYYLGKVRRLSRDYKAGVSFEEAQNVSPVFCGNDCRDK